MPFVHSDLYTSGYHDVDLGNPGFFPPSSQLSRDDPPEGWIFTLRLCTNIIIAERLLAAFEAN